MLRKALKNVDFIKTSRIFTYKYGLIVFEHSSHRRLKTHSCVVILLWQQMDFLHATTGRSILKNSRKLQILQRGVLSFSCCANTNNIRMLFMQRRADRGSTQSAGGGRERMGLRW